MNNLSTSTFAVLKKTKKPLQIQMLKLANPTKNQLLVKMKYSYICGTQLNEINGKKGFDPYLPHTLGHEASGEVLKVGKKVKNFKIGDKVILSWIKKKGKDDKSPFYIDKHGKKINSGHVSTFSEQALVSKSRVYKVPKKLPLDIAALFGCAIPTGFGMILKYLKNISKNNYVGVYGAGGVGLMTVIALRSLKIKNIYSVDKNKKNLNIVKKFGCKKIFQKNTNKDIKININKNLIKYNIEISGNEKMMELAYKNLSNDGLCILAGNIKKGNLIQLNPYDLIFGKKIVGFSGNDVSLENNLKLYYKLITKINISKLRKIFKVYKFKDINKAIKDFNSGKILRPLIKF